MRRCALELLLCVVHASAHDFTPLNHYLAQFKLDNLRPLHVEYANGSTPMILQGAETLVYVDDKVLKRAPTVTWEAEAARTFSIFFIDFGQDVGGSTTQTPFFPFVHSLWTQCTATLADCQQKIKAYLAPGNPYVTPNRYTYMLFRHRSGDSPLMLDGKPAARFLDPKLSRSLKKAVTGLSISRLLKDNVGLEAVAVNFAHVRGRKPDPPAKAAGGRRKSKHRRRRLTVL